MEYYAIRVKSATHETELSDAKVVYVRFWHKEDATTVLPYFVGYKNNNITVKRTHRTIKAIRALDDEVFDYVIRVYSMGAHFKAKEAYLAGR